MTTQSEMLLWNIKNAIYWLIYADLPMGRILDEFVDYESFEVDDPDLCKKYQTIVDKLYSMDNEIESIADTIDIPDTVKNDEDIDPYWWLAERIYETCFL